RRAAAPGGGAAAWAASSARGAPGRPTPAAPFLRFLAQVCRPGAFSPPEKGNYPSRKESLMSTRFRCPHCCLRLSGAARFSAEPEPAPSEEDRLVSSHFCTRKWVVLQLVAGLLAGVAGVVLCVWAVERGAPGPRSKKLPATAGADARAEETPSAPVAQERAPQGPASVTSVGQRDLPSLSPKAVSRPAPGQAKAIAPPLQGRAVSRPAAPPRAAGPAPKA